MGKKSKDFLLWVGSKPLECAWSECERGDWMLDWAVANGADRKLVVMAACACARTALQYVRADEDRPRAAIETAEAWARGEASAEEAWRAADSAYSAYVNACSCTAHEYAADAAYGAVSAIAYDAGAAYASAMAVEAGRTSAKDSAISLGHANTVRAMIPFDAILGGRDVRN